MSTTDLSGDASTDGSRSAKPEAVPHPHAQSGYQVRFDWGVDGALLLADAAIVVVVDVLGFSTAVELAVSAGAEVLPWGARDHRGDAVAAEHGAVLVESDADRVDLSNIVGATGAASRVVLCSRDGGEIARALADRGATVIAGGLRNRTAVAEWVLDEQERRGERTSVAVIAAGESTAARALRPAVEDLLAAGAVLAALTDAGIDHCSPEAAAAAAAYTGLRRGIGHLLAASASAEQLRASDASGAGVATDADLAEARQVDASRTVPVLREFSFRS